MPARIPKACRLRGCPRTTTHRHGYCDAHADKAHAKQWKGSGKGRGGRPWRRRRDRIRDRANGLCEECDRNGLVVPGCICDHITPEAEGGTEGDDNLQWLCQSCSDEKTKQEAARGQARALTKG